MHVQTEARQDGTDTSLVAVPNLFDGTRKKHPSKGMEQSKIVDGPMAVQSNAYIAVHHLFPEKYNQDRKTSTWGGVAAAIACGWPI